MHRTIAALACALALTLAACSGDNPDEAVAADDAPVLVTAVDYAYEGLPESVPAGTELALTNDAETELHEIVLVRIPDEEDRALPDLLEQDEAELMGLLMPNLVGVAVAPPSGDGVVVEGDLTVAETGRYALLCVIPTGADPDEYMEAAAEAEDGPPQVDGGPPHIVHGMFAELTVDA